MKPIELGHGITIAPLSIELTGVHVAEDVDSMRGRYASYTFRFRVRHRDTGAPTKLELTERVLYDKDGAPYIPLIDTIRRVLQQAMCHEVDEVLRVDGKRFRDPHE